MMMRRILLGIMLFALVPLALAANDPGHDSLYVLKIGDSNVVGSINLTGNLNASFVKITQRLFGDYLDVVGNGTVLGSPSQPRVMGASNALYIDSTGNLYLNTKGGTTGVVQLGDTTTNAITLNVSGIIRQQNVAVCLSNGSNCISGNNTGNVSTVTAGAGLANSGTAVDPILDVGAGDGISVAADTVAVDSTVCRSTGTNCPAGATGSAGWLNTSTQVYLANNASNVTVGNYSGLPVFFIDNANKRVGLFTRTPMATLSVNGTIDIGDPASEQISGPAVDFMNTYGNVTVQNIAGVLTFLVPAAMFSITPGHVGVNVTSLPNPNLFDVAAGGGWFSVYPDGTVGIKGARSTSTLDVNGTANITGTIYQNTVAVCLANGSNCPSSASGPGNNSGWVNTSTQVHLANNATNVTVGYLNSAPVFFVNNANGSVGFMTDKPLAPVFIQQRINDTVLYVNASAQGGNADVPSVRIDSSDLSVPLGIYYANGVKYTDMIANSDPTQLSAIRMYNTSGSLAALLGSYPGGGKLILYNRSAFGAGVLLTSNVSETSWFMANVAIGDVTSTQKLTVIGNINASGPGNIYYQGNLTGYGADLAEMVFGRGALEPGDVVIISDAAKTVELARVAYDTRVAGIVSTDPSHLMSAEEGDVPLALAGRVPVKVTTKNGPIRPGDLLTTSDVPGHAMRCESGCAGAIVGKAMEPLEDGEGMIVALVVLG